MITAAAHRYESTQSESIPISTILDLGVIVISCQSSGPAPEGWTTGERVGSAVWALTCEVYLEAVAMQKERKICNWILRLSAQHLSKLESHKRIEIQSCRRVEIARGNSICAVLINRVASLKVRTR